MARFLQQFEIGSGDYTQNREEWLKGLTVHDVVAEIKSRREKQGGRPDAKAPKL